MPEEEIPKHLDPVAPIFFVSHATAYLQPDAETEANAVFSEFVRDLNEDLNYMMPRRAGANPGFIDRRLRTGSIWEREILTAIGTCQVLVALVSVPFCESDWCGMEWDAFTRRRTWRRSDSSEMKDAQCVLPVLWVPDLENRNPQIVKRHQRFRPRRTSQVALDQVYELEGIYGMYRTDHDAYRATVWRIALEIQSLVNRFWVEPLVLGNADSLINVFAEEDS